MFADNPEYDDFENKFEPKKTTDDCYTPPLVYDAVKDWACREYGIQPESIVRPFYPGGDYETFAYPEGCCVLDNPPFSILSGILEFYIKRGIAFFLFAPALTALSGRNTCMKCNHIVTNNDITYENGAVVRTAFITSFGGDIVAQTAPELYSAIERATRQIRAETARQLPKYTYPDYVLTAAMLGKLSRYGIDYKVRRGSCVQISALDSQKADKKAIFGTGLLLSEKAAAEKAAAEKATAEKAAATVWGLSGREKAIIAALD